MNEPEPPLSAFLFLPPLFQGLGAEDCARLIVATRERRFAKGETVFLKGDRPTGLLVVVAGLVKETCQSSAGGEKIIELLGAGQSFGEAAMLLDCPYPFNALTLAPTRLLHVGKAAIADLVELRPEFAKRMMLVLAEKVCMLMDDIEAYSVQSPVKRVVRYLVDRCGVASSGQKSIALPAPKLAIASRLGMTPEALSRTLHDLAEAGLIKIETSRVDVRDLARLKAFAQ